MMKEEPYDSIYGGRTVGVHMGVILDFFQCSQGLEVHHMICHLPLSKISVEIPLSPILPSTPMVDILFGQLPTTLIIPRSVCHTNSKHMHYFAKFEN